MRETFTFTERASSRLFWVQEMLLVNAAQWILLQHIRPSGGAVHYFIRALMVVQYISSGPFMGAVRMAKEPCKNQSAVKNMLLSPERHSGTASLITPLTQLEPDLKKTKKKQQITLSVCFQPAWFLYICCLYSVLTLGPQETQQGACKNCSRQVNPLKILWRGKDGQRGDFHVFEIYGKCCLFSPHCNTMRATTFPPVTYYVASLSVWNVTMTGSETRSVEPGLGELVWEGATEGASVWDTGRIYKQNPPAHA